VNLDKQTIIDHLKERGEDDKAAQAQSDLPEQVDTDEHASKLQQLGINPQELLGGLGDKFGL
jgi:hypothetical protein